MLSYFSHPGLWHQLTNNIIGGHSGTVATPTPSWVPAQPDYHFERWSAYAIHCAGSGGGAHPPINSRTRGLRGPSAGHQVPTPWYHGGLRLWVSSGTDLFLRRREQRMCLWYKHIIFSLLLVLIFSPFIVLIFSVFIVLIFSPFIVLIFSPFIVPIFSPLFLLSCFTPFPESLHLSHHYLHLSSSNYSHI